MRILLCAATRVEASACEKAATSKSSLHQIDVLQTGMGSESAEGSLRAHLKKAPRPDCIISTGFAGSRTRSIGLRDWVLGKTETSEQLAWTKRLESSGVRFHLASVRTVDEVVTTEDASVAASDEVVDMESSALEKVAHEFGIPFQIIRLISDTVDDPLPEAIKHFSSGSPVKGLISGLSNARGFAKFIGRATKLPTELTDGWKKVIAVLGLGFVLFISGPAHALTVDQYLTQVEKSNEGYRAMELDVAGQTLSAKTSDLIFKPQTFTNLQFTDDPRDTHSPELYGDHTLIKSVSAGFREQTPWGLQLQLSLDYTQETLLGISSPLITRPVVTNLYPVPVFNWSLWQNFGGRLDRANQRMSEAEAKAKIYGSDFQAKAMLVEAEGRYWKLAALREADQIIQSSLLRAKSVLQLDTRKEKRSLIDSGDLLLSESAVQGKELELKSIQTEERSAARSFNQSRGVDSDVVNDVLELPDLATFESWKVPERKGGRLDAKVAEQQSIASEAGYSVAREKLLPNVSIFGSIFAVGLGFSMPLDQGLTSDAKDGYAKQAQAAQMTYRQKLFEQESDWSELTMRFQDNLDRLKLAVKLEELQKKKFEDANRRRTRGMTVAFQVFQYELDYLAAAQTRLQIQGNLLGLKAQAKLYAEDATE